MQIIITGKNMDLTDPIKEYVEKKIGGLAKFYDQIIKAEVTVGLISTKQNKGRIYVAECKLDVPGNDLYASKIEERDLYKSIDKVKNYLELELKKHKTKLREQQRVKRKDTRDTKEYSVE